MNETTIVPIRTGERQDTHLLVSWGRRLERAEHSTATAVVRLAAAMCTPEVEWAIQRPGASTGHLEIATGLIGGSVEMDALRKAIEDAAVCSYPVLIQGETGTGKELVARALHSGSPRRGGAFCAINCAALTDDLFEAELFGYARGAFTCAVVQRAGLFEEAHRGTLFLDEVGELTQRAQAKLLRAVQEGEVRRLGENGTRQVDVRLVAATNRALPDDAAAGRFRQDLLFRLAVIQIHTPPLRRRRGDIEVLARHFWDQAQARVGGRAVLGTAVLEQLAGYDWPGNVRELENVVARLSVRAPRRGPIPVQALPREISAGSLAGGKTLAQARDEAERDCVRTALARALGRPGGGGAWHQPARIGQVDDATGADPRRLEGAEILIDCTGICDRGATPPGGMPRPGIMLRITRSGH